MSVEISFDCKGHATVTNSSTECWNDWESLKPPEGGPFLVYGVPIKPENGAMIEVMIYAEKEQIFSMYNEEYGKITPEKDIAKGFFSKVYWSKIIPPVERKGK